MPLFPPGTPVTVLLDGRPLASYEPAVLAHGRVLVPVSPLLTRAADRLWFDGDTLVLERAGRRVRVRMAAASVTQLDSAYVAAGPVLRALGVPVRYDPMMHRLVVSTPPQAVGSPTPFNAALPSVVPTAVFTPPQQATPRPIWTGSPLPRRTALPLPPPHVEISS
ncbi:MAG: hypothetical protein JO104_06215 [Candidatus Eremiobacteraeota bacterium]|nr:hypothetical protein [Candidatus Eremiobacteraeota bacterium]